MKILLFLLLYFVVSDISQIHECSSEPSNTYYPFSGCNKLSEEWHWIGTNNPGSGDVHITRTGTKIWLLLKSYDSFSWKITADPEVEFAGLIVSSYEPSTFDITSLSQPIPIIKHTSYQENNILEGEYLSGSSGPGIDGNFYDTRDYWFQFIGVPLVSFSYCYETINITIQNYNDVFCDSCSAAPVNTALYDGSTCICRPYAPGIYPSCVPKIPSLSNVYSDVILTDGNYIALRSSEEDGFSFILTLHCILTKPDESTIKILFRTEEDIEYYSTTDLIRCKLPSQTLLNSNYTISVSHHWDDSSYQSNTLSIDYMDLFNTQSECGSSYYNLPAVYIGEKSCIPETEVHVFSIHGNSNSPTITSTVDIKRNNVNNIWIFLTSYYPVEWTVVSNRELKGIILSSPQYDTSNIVSSPSGVPIYTVYPYISNYPSTQSDYYKTVWEEIEDQLGLGIASIRFCGYPSPTSIFNLTDGSISTPCSTCVSNAYYNVVSQNCTCKFGYIYNNTNENCEAITVPDISIISPPYVYISGGSIQLFFTESFPYSFLHVCSFDGEIVHASEAAEENTFYCVGPPMTTTGIKTLEVFYEEGGIESTSVDILYTDIKLTQKCNYEMSSYISSCLDTFREIHMIGYFEDDHTPIKLMISRTTRPIVLILQSYRTVNWVISIANPDVNISEIISLNRYASDSTIEFDISVTYSESINIVYNDISTLMWEYPSQQVLDVESGILLDEEFMSSFSGCYSASNEEYQYEIAGGDLDVVCPICGDEEDSNHRGGRYNPFPGVNSCVCWLGWSLVDDKCVPETPSIEYIPYAPLNTTLVSNILILGTNIINSETRNRMWCELSLPTTGIAVMDEEIQLDDILIFPASFINDTTAICNIDIRLNETSLLSGVCYSNSTSYHLNVRLSLNSYASWSNEYSLSISDVIICDFIVDDPQPGSGNTVYYSTLLGIGMMIILFLISIQ